MTMSARLEKPVLILLSAAAIVVGSLTLVASAQEPVRPASVSENEEHVLTGHVTEVTNDGLTVVDRGGVEHAFSMSRQAKVTLDGRQSWVTGLKPGTRARVVYFDGDPNRVTRIEAIQNQVAFGSQMIRDGRLASLADGRLTLNDRTGYPHEYTLADNVACTLDGKACVPGNLREDMTLRLTSSRETPMVVERIEALHQRTSFDGGNRVEGTVKGYVDRKLLMTDRDGYERKFYVSLPTIVSTDGQSSHPETLEPGTRVMVHLRPDSSVAATHIEAIRKDPIFGTQTVHEGRLVDVVGDRLTMIDEEGNTHTHTVLDQARCVRDGEVCELNDLVANDRIQVAVKWGDHQVVTRIEALDQKEEFSTPAPTNSGTYVAPAVQSPPVQVLPPQDPSRGPVVVP